MWAAVKKGKVMVARDRDIHVMLNVFEELGQLRDEVQVLRFYRHERACPSCGGDLLCRVCD